MVIKSFQNKLMYFCYEIMNFIKSFVTEVRKFVLKPFTIKLSWISLLSRLEPNTAEPIESNISAVFPFSRSMAEAEAEITKKKEDAKASIANAQAQAMKDVESTVAKLALQIGETLIETTLDKKQAEKLTNTAIKSLN